MKKLSISLGLLASVMTVALSSSASHAQNLITNGDFSSGNTGFTNALIYTTPVDTVNGYLQPDGLYTLAKNPASHNNTVTGFDAHKNPGVVASFTDHTGDAAGNMLLINANSTGATETAWQQNVSALGGGATYTFSASFAYWGLPSDAANTTFRFSILAGGTGATTYTGYLGTSSVFNPPSPTGNTTVPAVSPAAAGVWATQQFTWTNTTNATNVTLRIESVNPSSGGFDYAVDDLKFQVVPEPSAIALLGIGSFVGVLRVGIRCRRSK